MDDFAKKPGALFWILGAVFVIWNGFGCAAYLMDVTASDAKYAELYGEAMLAVRDKFPVWSLSAYAIAVWGGLLAAVLYLLRKRLAVTVFVISLIAGLISFSWSIMNAEARTASGDAFWVMPMLVLVLGLIEIFWSRKMAAKGIIR